VKAGECNSNLIISIGPGRINKKPYTQVGRLADKIVAGKFPAVKPYVVFLYLPVTFTQFEKLPATMLPFSPIIR
jgi:hypothetical protein